MLLQQFINGITIGSTYALVAIGFTMIFGVLELTNFSNSSLYMFGAYMTWLLYGVGMNFFVAFALSIALTGLLGFSIDRFALRLLRKRHAPKLSGLITTLGMSMVIDNAIMVFCGTDSKSFENHLDFGKVYIGNAIISWTQIIILIVGFSLMIALSILVYRTKIGKAMTAIAQNQDAAKLMGIDTNKVIALTFVISGVLACIAGTMVAMYYDNGQPHRHQDLCSCDPRRRRHPAGRYGRRYSARHRGDHGLRVYQHRLPRCHLVYDPDRCSAVHAQRHVR